MLVFDRPRYNEILPNITITWAATRRRSHGSDGKVAIWSCFRQDKPKRYLAHRRRSDRSARVFISGSWSDHRWAMHYCYMLLCWPS